MSDVTRIGGVFFRTADPGATAAWYRTHLGLPDQGFDGATLGSSGNEAVWAPFPRDTAYFGPGDQQFMVNLVTPDLDGLLARLRAAGVEVLDHVEESDYGRFGWMVDCDGNRVELWQPPAQYPTDG
ncbi:MAG TPA: glyoxalase [Acidimicrobiaceae bacterium]|nr:glyoxalase [Acidimicrobiaceae bacterium]